MLCLGLPALADGKGPPYECIDAKKRARIQRVISGRANKEAFQPGGIYFPPLVMSDPPRSYWWVAGVYFQNYDIENDSSFRLIAPVYLSMCERDSKTVITPLHSYRRDAAGVAGLTLTYFWRRDELAESDVLFPFFWFLRERDVPGGPIVESTGAFAPFYFSGRKRTGDHWRFIPPLLFAQWGTDTEHTFIAGPAFGHSDPEGWYGGVFPLWFGGRSSRGDWDLIPPLLFHRYSDDENFNLWFANSYFRSGPDGWKFGVLPLLFGKGGGETHHLVLAPLFAHWGDAENETTIVGPGYYRSGPGGWRAGIVPLYFGGREGGERWDLVPPLLLYHERSPDHRLLHFANFYYYRDEMGWTSSFFPLVFAGRQGERHHTVVAPLYANWGDGETETTLVGPGYHHREGDEWRAGVIPAWFAGGNESKGERFDLIPPLLFYREKTPEETTLWFAQSWYQKNAEGWNGGSFPLFFARSRGEDHHLIIPPLLFGHVGNGQSETTVAGPVYHHRRGEKWYAGVAPLWFSGGRQDERFDLVPPLLFYRKSSPEETQIYFANNWYERDQKGWRAGSFPFFFAKSEGEEHHLMIPPLFFHFGDAETETTVFPPGWFQSTERGWNLGILPLVFAGREDDDHYFVVPPLFWRWGDGWTTTTVFANLFYRSTVNGWSAGIVPIYFGGRDGEKVWDIIPPLVWHFGDEEGDTWFIAPGYYHETEDGWDAGVIPLWFGGQNATRRYDVIPPLLFYRRASAAKLTLWAANTYFHSEPDKHTLAVVPFYFSGRDGDDHWELIPPLLMYHQGDGVVEKTLVANVYFETRPDGYTLNVLPVWFMGRQGLKRYTIVPLLFMDFEDELAQTRTTWVGPGWSHRGPRGWSAGLLPLWFAGGTDDWRFDLVLPLLGHRYQDDDFLSWNALNLYYWRTPEHRRFGLFPLYLAGRSANANWDVVPPLLAHRYVSEDTTTWSFLNTWYRSSPDHFYLTIAPLFFTGRKGDEFHTVVPPLFWRWGDAEQTTTIVGPGYYHRNRRSEKSYFGLAPLYFGSRTATESFDLVPALLAHRYVSEDTTTWSFLNTWYRNSPDHFYLTIAPLFFTGRKGDEFHTVVPPLFWRWGDAKSSTTIVGPAYYHGHDAGWDAGVAPFYFGGRSDTSRYDIIPPLLTYHRRNGEQSTTIVANFWSHTDGDTWRGGVFPFYWGGRDPDGGYDIVPPLFRRKVKGDQLRVTLFPLFDYQRDATSSLLLSPLFVRSLEPGYERTVVAGLYWRFEGPDTSARVVFPLWWDFEFHDEGTRLTTVFPFYWRWQQKNDVTHVVLNIAWSKGVGPNGPTWSFHLVPLISLTSNNPEHFKWQTFGGLAGYERQGTRKRYRIAYVWTEPAG